MRHPEVRKVMNEVNYVLNMNGPEGDLTNDKTCQSTTSLAAPT